MVLTEQQRNAKRERARDRREQGLCANCNDNALPGESRCEKHLQGAAQTTINQTADGTTHMKKVRLAQLLGNPWQPRMTMDDKYIETLAADILSVGRLLQEPLTRPDGDDAYQLAFGHSRIAALRLLHERKQWPATVTVKVSDLSDEEMAYIALSENRARKDLTALEELSAWSKALEIDKVTIQSLADRVGVHYSTMSKNLAILKLPTVVLEHIDDRRLSLRAARELLCLRTDTHSHDDMIEAVLKDCSGDSGTGYGDMAPDFRTQTVRASIRALARGRSHRGVYGTGHDNQDKNWRPLFDKEDDYAGRPIPFDVKDFTKEYPDDIHYLPDGKDFGGLPWTCQVKAWSSWSARATRERTKAEAEVKTTNTKNNGAAAATQPKPAPKPQGSKWLQAVKQDPLVSARLDAATLRKLKTDDDLEGLPQEDREVLGTRILKVPNRHDGNVNALPTAAQPYQEDAPGDEPPMFDFADCGTCTIGASWAETYHGSGMLQLVCTNRKEYMDKQSVGIEKFLAWRDATEARAREEDLKVGMKLASVLSPGLAKIVMLSLVGVAREAKYMQTWRDDNWQKYNVPPAAAEQFAAMVGRDLPSQGSYERIQWGKYLEEFADDTPPDFDWPAAAAWLVMWQARLNAGFEGELTAMAMATQEKEEPHE